MPKRTLARRTLPVLCLCAVAAVFSGTAFIGAGAAQRRSLPESFLIGDTEGVQVNRDGAYCILAEDLEPGDVIEKRLVIQNLDQGKPESALPYTLLMLAEPLEETGPVKLLDAVRLELKLEGKVIYSGPCRGNAQGNDMTQTPLHLGDYESGDRRDMEITLAVDGEMPVARAGEEQSTAEFAWHFYAVRVPEPAPGSTAPGTAVPPGTNAPPGEPPKTGDMARLYVPYAVTAMGPLLLCFALVLSKKRRGRGAFGARLPEEAPG